MNATRQNPIKTYSFSQCSDNIPCFIINEHLDELSRNKAATNFLEAEGLSSLSTILENVNDILLEALIKYIQENQENHSAELPVFIKKKQLHFHLRFVWEPTTQRIRVSFLPYIHHIENYAEMGFVELDRTGTIVWENIAAESFLGVPKDKVSAAVGQNAIDIVKNGSPALALWIKHITTGYTIPTVQILPYKSIYGKKILLKIFSYYDAPFFQILGFMPFTPREQYLEFNQIIQGLVYHDIANILQRISLLKHKIQIFAKRKMDFEKILKTLEHLYKQIDLMTFRMKKAYSPIRDEDFLTLTELKLNLIIKDAIDQITAIYPKIELSYPKEIVTKEIWVYFHPALSIIIYNLLENSYKHNKLQNSENNTMLPIEITINENVKIFNHEYVQIIIRDLSGGIDPNLILPNNFLNPKDERLGGLLYCHKLVQILGGFLTVHLRNENKRKGTIFKLTIPKYPI